MTIKEEIEVLKLTNKYLVDTIELLMAKIDYLIAYSTNNWEVKNNQMIIYDGNNEILEIYDLLDSLGNPTTTSVYKRVKK